MMRLLVAALALALAACEAPRGADSQSVVIDPSSLVWNSAEGEFWDVADLLEKDGVIWLLSNVDPFLHALQGGEVVAAFGRRGQGPTELRSATALLDRGHPGEITVWDAAARSYRTFSAAGAPISTQEAPSMGGIRGDIDNVTFGDPMRVVGTGGQVIRAEYPSGVSGAGDLWTATVTRFHDAGGVTPVVRFADLAGASFPDRRSGSLMVPVPLWDACPDGRIVVLDPIAAQLYLVGSSWAERDSLSVTWEPGSLTVSDRHDYLVNQIRAELRGQDVADADIQAMAKQVERQAREEFPAERPLAVDVRCAPGRLWLQEFDGGTHPLGQGRRWRTIALADGAGEFVQLSLPAGFQPYEMASDRMLGVVTDSLGLQRVATVEVPESLRPGS